jgi:hypothetical protein
MNGKPPRARIRVRSGRGRSSSPPDPAATPGWVWAGPDHAVDTGHDSHGYASGRYNESNGDDARGDGVDARRHGDDPPWRQCRRPRSLLRPPPEAAPSVSVPQSTTPAVPPAPVTSSGTPASPVTTAAETSDQGGRAPAVTHAHSVGANPPSTTGVSAAAARAASPATAPRGEPAADPVAAAPEGRATPKAFTRRSGRSASLGGLRVRSLPKLGNRLAVQLRFALDRAARITLAPLRPGAALRRRRARRRCRS